MKASELIDKLAKAINEYGDNYVLYPIEEYIYLKLQNVRCVSVDQNGNIVVGVCEIDSDYQHKFTEIK